MKYFFNFSIGTVEKVMMKRVIFFKIKIFIFFFMFIVQLLSIRLSLAQQEIVEVRYQSFKISYHIEDENLSKIVMNNLKSSVADYESFYALSLKGIITIRLPVSRREYEERISSRLPDWSNGYYSSRDQSITLKKPEWYMTGDDFGQVLRHELSHVFFHSKFQGVEVPLWLNEGLAEYLSGNRIYINQGLVISNALFANSLVTLSDIDSLNYFNVMRARLAYHESLTAVIFLEKLLEKNKIPWDTFFEWINNKGFPAALKQATTLDVIDFEIAWYRWLKDTYQWFLIFNWENLIWLVIIVILLGSIYAIRYRNQKILKDWEEQESIQQEQLNHSVTIDNSDHDRKGI